MSSSRASFSKFKEVFVGQSDYLKLIKQEEKNFNELFKKVTKGKKIYKEFLLEEFKSLENTATKLKKISLLQDNGPSIFNLAEMLASEAKSFKK